MGSLDALTLWFIGQHPGMRLNWGSRPAWDQVWDQDGYERGKQLWTAQLKKSWDSPFVYMNAAEFLSGNDDEQAEQILLEGRRRFPSSDRRWSGLHWEVFLARHYAWALTGSAGQLPQWETAVLCDESDAPPAQGPYAQKVRQTLSASKDTELLTRTAEQLQGNRPNLEFCRSLIERVLAIDPDNRHAHVERDNFRRFMPLEMPRDGSRQSERKGSHRVADSSNTSGVRNPKTRRGRRTSCWLWHRTIRRIRTTAQPFFRPT